MSAELFPPDTDYGRTPASLRRHRRLVARVYMLADIVDETFPAECHAVAYTAERVGAHSIARVCRWLTDTDALGRHGYDAMHIRAERVADRWLERLERRRTTL